MGSVDGVALSGAQDRRWSDLVRAYVLRGLEGDAADAAASKVWRTLYRVSGVRWVRREVATTSRGVAFGQRPEEGRGPLDLLGTDLYGVVLERLRPFGAVHVFDGFAVVVRDGEPLLARWSSLGDGSFVLDEPDPESGASAEAAMESVRLALGTLRGVELSRAAIAVSDARRLSAR